MQLEYDCSCGSGESYEHCCASYHQGVAAPTPVTLMRSRYTAYTQANMVYIEETMCGQPLEEFDSQAAYEWASSVEWLGLEIIDMKTVAAEHGYVTFIARYMEQGVLKIIHERSEFKQINGKWFYVAGVHSGLPKQKMGRNQLCFCGSQKKFKHCHGKNS